MSILATYNLQDEPLGGIIATLIALVFIISYLSIQVKRCNDLGWPRIAVLLSFSPGFIPWLLILGIIESKESIGTLVSKAKDGTLFSKAKEITSNAKGNMREKEVRSYNKLDKDNFEKYTVYTRDHNWQEICKFNNVDFDSFGTKKELESLPSYLEDDEVVFALTSGLMKQTKPRII